MGRSPDRRGRRRPYRPPLPQGYNARPEQVLLSTVTAWDANCPQLIPQRFEASEVEAALSERDAKIAALTSELALLKAGIKGDAYWYRSHDRPRALS